MDRTTYERLLSELVKRNCIPVAYSKLEKVELPIALFKNILYGSKGIVTYKGITIGVKNSHYEDYIEQKYLKTLREVKAEGYLQLF